MKIINITMRSANIVIALLVLVGTAIAAYATTTWIPPVMPGDPGAAFFPRIALAVMFVFSAILLLQTLRRPASDQTKGEQRTKSVSIELSGFIVTLIYSSLLVIGIELASFEISCFAFLAYMLGLRTGRWPWSIVTALISTVCIYLLFVLALQVRLPLLFLPSYISF